MKAKIVDNLVDEIEKVMPLEGHRHDPEFLRLAAAMLAERRRVIK